MIAFPGQYLARGCSFSLAFTFRAKTYKKQINTNIMHFPLARNADTMRMNKDHHREAYP